MGVAPWDNMEVPQRNRGRTASVNKYLVLRITFGLSNQETVSSRSLKTRHCGDPNALQYGFDSLLRIACSCWLSVKWEGVYFQKQEGGCQKNANFFWVASNTAIFYNFFLRTSAVSSTNLGSILIFASYVVGTCSILCW